MAQRTFTVVAACAVMLLAGITSVAAAEGDARRSAHRSVPGVVIEKDRGLAVQTPDGATFMLDPAQRQSERHGHAPFKAGDAVTVTIDENNLVTEIHPKGESGDHHFVSGKLIHVGKMKSEIKLETSEGERVFPLDRQELKTKPLEEGARVTVELNEAGRVIDLHREGEQQKR